LVRINIFLRVMAIAIMPGANKMLLWKWRESSRWTHFGGWVDSVQGVGGMQDSTAQKS
jgi:hypothetical protein